VAINGLLLTNNPRWREGLTRTVKATFGDLGQKLGYRVAASGFRGHFDEGWVYDLTWFIPGEGKFEVAMAMESELDTTSATNFDDDFLKLLDSTADVRVWLAWAADPPAVDQYIENYLHEAKRFKKMIPGTIFIFVMFEWKTRTTFVKRFTMSEK
jgi:hypothetical protein